MAYIPMAFEMNIIMNHVNKCKPDDWPNWVVVKLSGELRKWVQPSDLTAMLELTAES